MSILVSTGYENFKLNYNPKKYKTKAGAAKALYKALVPVVKSYGQKPESELHIWEPGQNGSSWRVSWEAGPYEWAIYASFHISNMSRDGGWFTEPHYSFDLCFTD